MTDLVRQIEQMHDVGRLHLMGNDPNDIARLLGIPRKDVLWLFREWKKFVSENTAATSVRDRLIDIIEEGNQHWQLLVKEAWNTVSQADEQDMLAVKVQAMKLAAGIEKDRITMYQQLGASYDAQLAEDMAEQERQVEALKQILRDVVCDDCKPEILRRLNLLSNESEPIEIEADEP